MPGLIAAAEQHDTATLKVIQRNQRRLLMLAKRNHHHLQVRFLQARVDAAEQVLASRRK